MAMWRVVVRSPVGSLTVLSTEAGLRSVCFEGEPQRGEPSGDPHGAASALDAYFGGDLVAIDRLPTDVPGTDFQRAVWAALRAIPAGSATTYGELARRLGKPDAVRAVGQANGRNPVAIVVPCHRVVATGGGLGGYDGGLPRKEWLLAHERYLLIAPRDPLAS